ncbi:MAG: NAD(P)-dependent oxidoreductase [Candidatus Lokiarchaeia archaeon]|nr:NAD(P)-dependent oxidoreductase [Candidatus Lokiarchaeia archaeon]
MKKKKILLTGASGTVGKEIFKELISRIEKFEISLLLRPSRKNRRHFKPWKKTANIIWGDIQNYNDVEKAVLNNDLIIHAAGVLPDIALYNPDLAKRTNIGGTSNVLDAIKVQKNVPKIMYTSSAAVYGKGLENSVIKVSDPVISNPKDVYTYTKIESEKLIANSGVDYCIFRISYVTSVDMLRFRPVMFHIPLDSWLEIIHAKDVALAIVNALELDEIWGKMFNLGGGKDCQIQYRENLSDYYEIMGFGRDFLPETAFAKEGLYCGIFDSQETQNLQNLLKYQRHTIQDFYYEVKKWIGFKRYLTPIIKPIARWYILRKSELYQNLKKQP